MKSDNPYEKILNKLRTTGWRQGWFGDESGPNCIYGAAVAEKIDNLLVDDISPIVEEQYPDRMSENQYYNKVVVFNDHGATTFEDVERVLEKAAIKWEENKING